MSVLALDSGTTALLRNSLDQLDVGISVFDADLNMVYFNTQFLKLYKFPPGLAQPGTPFETFIRYNAEHGEYGDCDIETEVRFRVERARKFEAHTVERTTPDGRVLEIQGSPLPGGGFITTYTDISERRNAEVRLRESEERFRRLVELAPDAILVHQGGTIVYANRQAQIMMGAPTPTDLIGRSIIEIIDPACHDLVAKRLKLLARGEQLPLVEMRLVRLDGGQVEVESTMGMTTYGGHRAMQSVWRDISARKQAEAASQAAKDHFLAFARSTPDALIAFDEEGRIVSWNEGAEAVYGFRQDEILGSPLSRLIPERYHAINAAWVKRMAKDRGRHNFTGKPIEAHGLRKNGEEFPVEFSVGRWREAGRNFFSVAARDISKRKQSEEKLRHLSQAVEQSPADVVITDAEGIIQYVNPRFSQVTGYASKEVIGKKPSILKSGRTPAALYESLWETITAGKEWRGELMNRKKDGSLFWQHAIISPIRDNSGAITHYISVKEDISIRKEYEERLVRQANYDALTGLPNRILAMDRLKQAIAQAQRYNRKVALMLLDLDDFKKVNDTLGHAAGDLLLKEAALRLVDCLREGDTVARLGGDEFVLLLPDLTDISSAEVVAEKILTVCNQPFDVGGHEAYIAGSIGIAIFPDDERDPILLMRNADAAMYRSKREGKGVFRYFTPEMNARALEHMRMESQLRHAIERNEMKVHYQPLVDSGTGRLVGAEALLRWSNPVLGEVSPEQFIPLAEETGLILSIGAWVLRTACRDAASWQRPDHEIFVAVNISGKQFQKRTLVDTVRSSLRDSGLPPACLELELTESVLLEHTQETLSIIQELESLGVGFAIDDFGTGFSSISYLRRFPFDTLKIDRSFIKDLGDNEGDADLVKSIIAMANSMSLKVVGEGVETHGQREFLRLSGCHIAQGWLYSRPIPGKDFQELIDGWTHAKPQV
ncbi:MAG: EAL domain-containing protein [Alphaproteobacteria bacterium]|nr:EAL domain-containing protein [Alphaproteobacteria bacterium]